MASPYFVARYYGEARGGIGRYEESLFPLLHARVGAELLPVRPLPLPMSIIDISSRCGLDLESALKNYPCWIGRHDSSLVHWSNQTLALGLPFYPDARHIVTVHDIAPYVLASRSSEKIPQGNWERWLCRLTFRLLKMADRLVADSEFTKSEVIRHLGISPRKVEVVPLGTNHDIFRPMPVETAFYARLGLDPQGTYLLYVGSQNPRKNLDVLLEATQRVRESIPELKLIMVGEVRDKGPIGDLTSQLKIVNERWVRLLGFVSEEDLVRLYNLADALALPSTYEGFGLPALEAMACGCPVLASRATAIPEVVGDAGILLDSGDVEAWSLGIASVLQDEELRERIRSRGIQRSREFSWDRTAELTIQAYRRVMA